MKLPHRQKTVTAVPGLVGTARVDRRTPSVIRRLQPGDVAVIDHLDLDRASAQALADTGAAAVVNASAFISGRLPNLGPEVLVRSGVVLVDGVGTEVFSRLRDGARVRLHEGTVYVDDDEPVAGGRELGHEQVQDLMDTAREGLSTHLQSFTHNTVEFLRREEDLLLHGQGVPAVRTRIAGRPVVVVVAGHEFRAELRRLRRYINEQRPVLVGVDDGADALLEAGHRPDLVVIGEAGLGTVQGRRGTAASDKGLRAAREVVLHTDRVGRALGAERLDRLGVKPRTFPASGTSADVALLLADLSGAAFIVSVGSRASLDELLDSQRSGLASMFLTRLRVGAKVVDASSVPQLYTGRLRAWHLFLVLLAGVLALLVAVAATPVGHDWWQSVQGQLHDLLDWTQGQLP